MHRGIQGKNTHSTTSPKKGNLRKKSNLGVDPTQKENMHTNKQIWTSKTKLKKDEKKTQNGRREDFNPKVQWHR